MSKASRNKRQKAGAKRPPFRPIKLLPTQELNNAPGYKEAVITERRNRLLAFADVSQTICGGFELLPLTLERYNVLRIAESPLLRFQIPKPSELATFLWAMSGAYRFRLVPFVRRLFYAKCRREFLPAYRKVWQSKEVWNFNEAEKVKRTAQIVGAIFSTFAQVFQDAPKLRSKGDDDTKSFYDMSVSIVGTIARNYGWTEREVLRKPVARLLQYRRECLENDHYVAALHAGKKFTSPLDNPSDAIKMKCALEFGRKQAEASKN